MKPLVAIVCGVTVLCGARAASADGYLALGIGSSANLGADLEGHDSHGRSGRAAIGQRFGGISIEANLGAFGANMGNAPYDAIQYGVAGRYNARLLGNLEGYGRFGIERTHLRPDGDSMRYRGNGYAFGAGLEFGLDIGLASGSIFLDWTRHSAGLRGDDSRALDMTASLWTAGLSVSL